MSKPRKILAALAAMATVTTLTVSAFPASAWVDKTIVDEDGFAFTIKDADKNDLRDAAFDDFLHNNEIEAVLGGKDRDHLEVIYIYEKDKDKIEDFIKCNGYDNVIVREATQDEKYDWICEFKLICFRSNNELMSDFNYNVSKDGERSLEIVCYAAHPGVQEKFESYISEHDYDKIVPISYKTVGSTDDTTDLKEITPILKNYVEENNIPAEVILVEDEYDENRSWINVDININDTVTKKLLRDFMEKNKLDQANVKFKTVKTELGMTLGDANDDGKTNVRDCACIANALANGEAESLPNQADYNEDTRKNVRDAASLSKDLAEK